MLLLPPKNPSSLEAGPAGGLVARAGGQHQGKMGKQSLLAHPLRDRPGSLPGTDLVKASQARGMLGLWD